MNMTHVTQVNGVERKIKSVQRVGVQKIQITIYEDESTFSSRFAHLSAGSIHAIHHHNGEIFIDHPTF